MKLQQRAKRSNSLPSITYIVTGAGRQTINVSARKNKAGERTESDKAGRKSSDKMAFKLTRLKDVRVRALQIARGRALQEEGGSCKGPEVC